MELLQIVIQRTYMRRGHHLGGRHRKSVERTESAMLLAKARVEEGKDRCLRCRILSHAPDDGRRILTTPFSARKIQVTSKMAYSSTSPVKTRVEKGFYPGSPVTAKVQVLLEQKDENGMTCQGKDVPRILRQEK